MPDKLGSEKLGDLLVKAGLIDELQLQTALGHQRRWGHKIGKCLIDLGFIEETELLKFLSEKFKIKAVDLTKSVITEQTFAVVQEAIAKKYGVVPVFIKEGPGNKKTIILAMSDPTDLKVVDEIQFLTGYRVEPVLATESAISKVLENYGKTYKPAPERKRDVTRPVDLRKEHLKEEKEAKMAESVEVGDAELLLGGEEVTEILDLKEAEEEGIEISPDEDIKVIKDEVVMVKAEKPKPKGTKIGTPTERIPMPAPIRDEVKLSTKIEPQPKPAPSKTPPKPEPPRRPAPEPSPELSLAPPEIELDKPVSAPVETESKPLESKPISPIEIPETSEEEKIELAQAHEFVSWEAKEPPTIKVSQEELLDEQELTGPAPPPAEQKLVQLSQPEEHKDDDFWSEMEEIAPPPKNPLIASEEERLPFEKPLSVPEPPPSVATPEPAILGTLEELTAEPGINESELYTATPAREISSPEEEPAQLPEEPGEMSLEFALKTIQELKKEIKQREFQFDELLSLMMKKEAGEITTEIYREELARIKKEIEKLTRKEK